MRKKIAVVGSGISGLGLSLVLSQKYEVHLFESDARLGGHAHTTDYQIGNEQVSLDTGFLVYNELNYPHLVALFKFLDVEVVNSDMSLSIQVPQQKLEWAGDNLDTVFAQRKNLFKPRFYKMLLDILRFHKEAEANCELARQNNWSTADLLKKQRYGSEIQEWYILPMLAAIWSTPERKMLDFPAETFLTFFLNHKLLQVNNRPQWKTVKNGSRQYVDKISKKLENIHLNEPVVEVEPHHDQVKLKSKLKEYIFDSVILTTQPSISIKILKTKNEKILQLLNSFGTVMNKAYLHQDSSFMPASKKCWSSWCVQAQLDTKNSNEVSLTYYLNRLQPLQTKQNLFLTLNPNRPPKNLLAQFEYGHPLFNELSIQAQKLLPEVQGLENVYFAGAWTRYGFHEDGLLSAVNVANQFGLKPQWMT